MSFQMWGEESIQQNLLFQLYQHHKSQACLISLYLWNSQIYICFVEAFYVGKSKWNVRIISDSYSIWNENTHILPCFSVGCVSGKDGLTRPLVTHVVAFLTNGEVQM